MYCPSGYPEIACFLFNIMIVIDAVIVPLIMAIAFITFLWGVFQYFIAGGASAEKREEGQKFVMWGLIGFVIIISLWGIINLLTTSLGFRSNVRPPIPMFGGTPQGGTGAPSTYGQQGGAPSTFGQGQGGAPSNYGQTGSYQSGWVCTQDSQCASGQCAIYNSPDGSDPGQRRCI